MFWSGKSTLNPGGVPQVQQHLRSGSEAASGEVECGRRTLSRKASDLFQRVDVLHQTVRLSKVVNVTIERILQELGTLHKSGEILVGNIRSHVGGLKLGMDAV